MYGIRTSEIVLAMIPDLLALAALNLTFLDLVLSDEMQMTVVGHIIMFTYIGIWAYARFRTNVIENLYMWGAYGEWPKNNEKTG
jgi:hypothetical protein